MFMATCHHTGTGRQAGTSTAYTHTSPPRRRGLGEGQEGGGRVGGRRKQSGGWVLGTCHAGQKHTHACLGMGWGGVGVRAGGEGEHMAHALSRSCPPVQSPSQKVPFHASKTPPSQCQCMPVKCFAVVVRRSRKQKSGFAGQVWGKGAQVRQA